MSSDNPWEQILKQAVGSAILVGISEIDNPTIKEEIIAAAAKAEITVFNIGEKYVDAQIESAQFPPVLGMFRNQIVSAVNTAIYQLRTNAASETDVLYGLLIAWAKQEGTKLGA